MAATTLLLGSPELKNLPIPPPPTHKILSNPISTLSQSYPLNVSLQIQWLLSYPRTPLAKSQPPLVGATATFHSTPLPPLPLPSPLTTVPPPPSLPQTLRDSKSLATVPEKTSTPSTFKPKATTTFLGCFRFSNKKTLRSHDYNYNKKKKIMSKSSRSSSSWFCRSRFRMNKSTATKTVPLDISTVSDKQAQLPNNSKLEPKSKQLESKHQLVAATDRDPNQREASVLPLIVDPDKTPNSEAAKPPETAADLENRRQGALKDDSCQKRRLSFCRKVESIRTGAAGGGSRSSSQPGSPVQQEKKPRPRPRSVSVSNTINRTTAISPFASPKRQRRAAIPSSARKTWFVSNERTMTSANKLDPLVGMTIIMLTLIIMLLWGRLCAILCTAAWFYLIPRLTNSNSSSTAGNTCPHPRDDLDFNSDEYKKKVVLEGFLERNNHRNHLL